MERVYRNVNDAFRMLVEDVYDRSWYHLMTSFSPVTKEKSRNGEVLRFIAPVLIQYQHPRERVLFNQARDCNPFFHVFEALWMLAGRNDVAPLVYFNPRMADYSDDGKTLNDAYGYRWRNAEGLDQLRVIAEHLERHPESRRAVLSMWNVEDDLLKIDASKAVCCNTHVYFSLRDGGIGSGPVKLDMTVCNRSNDLVWGMLGADYVHFTFLQEYMARRVGVGVGKYWHFTNNLHLYTASVKLQEWYEDKTPDYYGKREGDWKEVPLVSDPDRFDRECKEFVDKGLEVDHPHWKEPFLRTVASPMAWAFKLHKRRDYDSAFRAADLVEASDWRIASRNWLQKRRENWERKHERVETDPVL